MRTSTQTRYIVIALAVLALAVPVAPASGKSVDAASGDVAEPFAATPVAREEAPFAARYEQPRSATEIAPADGFDWGDAALGAGAGAIVVLAALAGVAALSGRRPRAA